MILQVETARELLSTTDITIAGILLSVIFLLIYDNVKKDKKIDVLNSYIRTQDKETLKILLELTNTLKSNQDVSKEVKSSVNQIDNTVNDSNGILKNLSVIIQNKILNMK